MSSADIILLSLARPDTWPEAIQRFLGEHYDLFLDWSDGPERFSAPTYDAAIYRLANLLKPYALAGWHCTRLTDAEIQSILSGGMQPPNESILRARINAVLAAGRISPETAAALLAKNQASEPNRRGRVWWCFYPPRLSGQGGIGALLGTWGGEALYNSHDHDPVMGPVLRSIGTPCLVEAAVPMNLLNQGIAPTFTVVAHYLRHRGHPIRDQLEFEDNIKEPLPGANIRRVIRHPEPAFLELTECETWHRPLGSGSR